MPPFSSGDFIREKEDVTLISVFMQRRKKASYPLAKGVVFKKGDRDIAVVAPEEVWIIKPLLKSEEEMNSMFYRNVSFSPIRSVRPDTIQDEKLVSLYFKTILYSIWRIYEQHVRFVKNSL
jgi:hypothetical protein